MPEKVSKDLEEAYDADLDVTGKSLVASLRSSWYYWAAAALMTVLSVVALLYQRGATSFFDEFLFVTLTLGCAFAGLVVVIRQWERIDVLQA